MILAAAGEKVGMWAKYSESYLLLYHDMPSNVTQQLLKNKMTDTK